MGAVAAVMEHWLEADRSVPRKQPHTAYQIWERLVDEYVFGGAEVGEVPAADRSAGVDAVGGARHRRRSAGGLRGSNCERQRDSHHDLPLLHTVGVLPTGLRMGVPAAGPGGVVDGPVRAFRECYGVPSTIWYNTPASWGGYGKGTSPPARSLWDYRARTGAPPTTATQRSAMKRAWSDNWWGAAGATTWCRRCGRSKS